MDTGSGSLRWHLSEYFQLPVWHWQALIFVDLPGTICQTFEKQPPPKTVYKSEWDNANSAKWTPPCAHIPTSFYV